MRRVLQIAAVLVTIVSLSIGIAVAVTPAARPRSVTPLGASTHYIHYFENGPGAFCEITGHEAKCGVATTEPGTFTLPAGVQKYSCTLTASVQYRTVGSARFGIVANIFAAKDVTVIPAARPVAGTHGVNDSRTLVFRPGYLKPGTKYTLDFDTQLAPNAKVQGSSSIETSKILADIECASA